MLFNALTIIYLFLTSVSLLCVVVPVLPFFEILNSEKHDMILWRSQQDSRNSDRAILQKQAEVWKQAVALIVPFIAQTGQWELELATCNSVFPGLTLLTLQHNCGMTTGHGSKYLLELTSLLLVL